MTEKQVDMLMEKLVDIAKDAYTQGVQDGHPLHGGASFEDGLDSDIRSAIREAIDNTIEVKP